MTVMEVRDGGGAERSASGIVTPEAVVLDVETAGYASRILAALIDLMIQLTLLFITSFLLGLLFLGDQSGVITGFAIASFLVIFGYPIGFETWLRGRTPGKMAFGLRAVTTDGAPIRLRDATLRAMGGVVDRLLPPGGVTGALFVLLTPRHQRLGDLIAGTMVIRDPEKHVATPALWFSPPPGLEQYAATIDPTAITVEQYTVIRSFLTRGTSLSTPIRATLARDLANRLAERIHHQPPQFVAPEVFLICAMARYQRRNGPGRAAGVPASIARTEQPGMPGTPGPGGDGWWWR
ncbi:MAG: RDD family protein [Ilumatobacter sp.]|uniref:RDD family protein n=1 Tax=Ilumatobacter sp. TaxID=1967498 RepID=UPI003C765547